MLRSCTKQYLYVHINTLVLCRALWLLYNTDMPKQTPTFVQIVNFLVLLYIIIMLPHLLLFLHIYMYCTHLVVNALILLLV